MRCGAGLATRGLAGAVIVVMFFVGLTFLIINSIFYVTIGSVASIACLLGLLVFYSFLDFENKDRKSLFIKPESQCPSYRFSNRVCKQSHA